MNQAFLKELIAKKQKKNTFILIEPEIIKNHRRGIE